MVILSKIQKVPQDITLSYNCYEVGHTWTPFCSEAAVEVGVYCLGESLKMYTPLYLLTLAFQRKFTTDSFIRAVQSIITSSCFLSFNAFAFIASLCAFRKILGRFSYLHCSYFPGLLANILAIAIERPSRRPALALYCMNLATETLFRMAVARKILTPLPYGEVLLFSTVMAGFLYIMRKKGFYNDFVSLGLRFLLGSEEAKLKPKKKPQIENNHSTNNDIKNSGATNAPPSFIAQKLAGFINFISILVKRGQKWAEALPLDWLHKLQNVGKHKCCPHQQSCLFYILKGFLRPLLLGYSVSLALGVASTGRKILLNKRYMKRILTNEMSLRFALFLGSFSGIFKGVSCALRWLRGKDSEIHALPAGLLAGASMALSPNSSVALYLGWKLVELVYHLGVEQQIFPVIPGSTMVLYSVSTAVLFYAAVLEPHNLKPTYRNFLNKVSANRLNEINRHVLDIFGVHSSKLHHDFWPDLDVKYTSKSFQETVLVWMIH